MREELEQSVESALPAPEFRQALQELTEAGAGIVRTETGLQEALQSLETLKSRRYVLGEKSPAYYYENRSLLLTAEAVLRAALLRDESRGPHLRFAHYEDNTPVARKEGIWEKYIVIRRDNAAMQLEIRQPALQ